MKHVYEKGNFMRSSAFSNLKTPGIKYALNLALLQGIFWVAWAFGNYSNYYLQLNGFTPAQIGALNSVCNITGIAAAFIFGYISDRINSVKKIFAFTLATGGVLFSIAPLIPLKYSYSVVMIFVYFALTNFFRGTNPTFLDNISVRTCAVVGINFGLIRCVGSITFSVASTLVQPVINAVGVGSIFPISGLLLLLTLLLLAFSYDPKSSDDVDRERKKEPLSLKPLLKNYYYVTFIVFSAVFYLAYNSEYSFLTYFFEERGIGMSRFGIFVAVRALTEVPMLLLMKRLRRRLRLKYAIVAAVLLISTYFLGLGLVAHSIGSMLFFAVLFGTGNGLLIGAFSTYLYKLAPYELKATAQTIYGAVSCAAGIAGNFCGGFIYDALRGSYYTLLGAATLFSALLFTAALLLRRSIPNPGDELN